MNKEETINYIAKKWNLDLDNHWDGTEETRTCAYHGEFSPIRIPNTERYHSLAGLFRELGFKEGAEVGVAAGTYSEALCKENPTVRLHCIDPWEHYEGYNDFARDYFAPALENTKKLLAPYNYNIIRKYSLDAVKDFKDGSLDFVYIDANHKLRHVLDDVDSWIVKIRPGGILAGHDWAESKHSWGALQVVPAMHAYTWANKIKPWFVFGRDERIPGEMRQRHRSWAIVV